MVCWKGGPERSTIKGKKVVVVVTWVAFISGDHPENLAAFTPGGYPENFAAFTPGVIPSYSRRVKIKYSRLVSSFSTIEYHRRVEA